jgi:hypothetical protein
MFDPEDYDYNEEGKVNFEIIVQPEIYRLPQIIDKIYWWVE